MSKKIIGRTVGTNINPEKLKAEFDPTSAIEEALAEVKSSGLFDGKDGAKWHSGTEQGNGLPTIMISPDVKDGDYYLCTTNGDVYVARNKEFKYVTSIKGDDGAPGTDGKDGSVWYTSTRNVAGSIYSVVNASAKKGDFCLNIDNGDVYYAGRSAAHTDVWVRVCNIKGADGAAGVDGSKWHVGTTIYADTMSTILINGSKDGDFYLNTDTYDVFHARNGLWYKVVNIRGTDGYTPEKGVDYWTAEDKAEMVAEVLSALPTWNGGSY